MFFRRRPKKEIAFEERIDSLRASGYEVEALANERIKVRKDCCAAVIEEAPGGFPRVVRAGVLLGAEITRLVDGGFQRFLEAPAGIRRPALAADLSALHDFEDGLREALGLESLYNESLGTVCDRHVYDRLTGRS
jgi:hypothetical protein